MSESDADSFNQDDVSDYVNGYADPFVDLKVTKETIEDGRMFVVIQVQEFTEIPVVCKKDGERGVCRGAIYTRPRRKIESVPVPSQTEMREILDLAVDKKIRKHIEDYFRWGMVSPEKYKENDLDRFEEQLGGL